MKIKPFGRVLEIGTKKWGTDSTHHKHWAPGAEWVLSDVEPGEDVDVVADAHELEKVFGPASFDSFIACSVWEHLHSPWIAALEVQKILKPGGVFFVQTHQSFPLHAYPHDYFRFSDKALRHLFSWAECETSLDYPCRIIPPEGVVWNSGAESFLNVCVWGRKAQISR